MDTLPHSQVVMKVEARLRELTESGSLSVAEALDRTQQIADLVEQVAGALEGTGDSERAADLYMEAARAFQTAAEKVPGADRRQVASLADFWLVKADMARYAAPSVPPMEEPKAPDTGSLTKAVLPDEPRPSTGAYKKSGGVGGGRRPRVRVPSFPSESEPSAVSRQGAPEVPGGRIGPQRSPAIREPKPPATALRRLSKVEGERWSPEKSPLRTRALRQSPVISEKPDETLKDGRQYQVQFPPHVGESKLSDIAGKLRQPPDSETSDEG